MNAVTPTPTKRDLQGLIDAIAQANDDESLNNPLKPDQWDTLSAYLQPCMLAAGQLLFNRGVTDRTLYLVESGSISVHYEDDKGRLRMAVVPPGSVLGEGGFFAHRPRSATAQAAAPSKLWALTALRFTELSNRQPAIALGLAMAAGAVMSKRLGNRRRRVAST
ncbi:MAG: cyclic nucleotide-binding domain-containing protein [Giesbergeria sp.]|jgi:CRP-like cAMP-binding protein|nr:cyclic nucleotide-binding domain-containing protein [Giesbergeria sp.]